MMLCLRKRYTRHRAVLLVSAILATQGCATVSADKAFDDISKFTKEKLSKELEFQSANGPSQAIQQRVTTLLSQPLSVDDAIQIALLNNRGLQAAFAELRIGEAEFLRATSLPNPHFSMLRASKPDGDIREFKIEQALTFNIFSLVLLPQVIGMERQRMASTQLSVTQEVLRLASETRKAYYNALAAQESVRYMSQVQEAAEAGAELAKRMKQIGNFNKLQNAREQGFYADAALSYAKARTSSQVAHEKLIRLLGLWGDQTALKLPQRLPDLPQRPNDLLNVEQMAMAQRLDLQQIRAQTESLARNLGLTKTSRFINILEFGPARVLEGPKGSGYKKGYEVAFELPIFDWGGARIARAEAIYMQALHSSAQVAIEARSEVRQAYYGYRSSFDIAQHYRDEIVPIRKRISDENQLRYNGMFIGVFDLLADARSQITAANSYIESLRDFWIAQADLEMALIGKANLSAAPMSAASGSGEAAAGH